MNARITATSSMTDALSEPATILSIHVEVWSFIYEGASIISEWASIGHSRSVVISNERYTGLELRQFLLSNLRS